MTQILRQAKHFRTHSVYTGQPFQQSLKLYPDNSFDSMVTDPPYGISFMNKHWDYDVPSVSDFKLLYDKIKPGGHILVACGTRTQHRMAVNIEDAGFEIRDIISWVYGSGFPKSLDISKAIDKMDAADEQLQRRYKFTAWVRSHGVTAAEIDKATDTCMGGHYTTAGSQPAIMTREHLEKCRHLFPVVPEWVERECDIRSIESKNFAEREVLTSKRDNGGRTINLLAANKNEGHDYNITAPATEDAKKWAGWGTALKPAMELWTLARKPLSENTVAANVLQHGTGGLNIDGCRVELSDGDDKRLGGKGSWKTDKTAKNVYEGGYSGDDIQSSPLGRFPANIIHDGSDEVLALFPDSKAGGSHTGKEPSGKTNNALGEYGRVPFEGHKDSGSAARFFYCAKASKAERAGSKHPTIKPISLMRYLCRLITPPGGTVLDPFAGSGTTAEAALLEGFSVVAMERDAHNLPDIQYRISRALTRVSNDGQVRRGGA